MLSSPSSTTSPLWTGRPLPTPQAPQNPLVGQATHPFSFRRRIICFREKARAACGVAARGLEETPPRRVLGTVSPHIFSSRWRGPLPVQLPRPGLVLYFLPAAGTPLRHRTDT